MDSSSANSHHHLDWRNHDAFRVGNGGHFPQSFDAETSEGSPWPIPDRKTMQDRWTFRQGIREETLQHRRIHRHGGLGDTGRNIALVLRDREVKGASAVTLRRRRLPPESATTAEETKKSSPDKTKEDAIEKITKQDGVNGISKDTISETNNSNRKSLNASTTQQQQQQQQQQTPQTLKRVCYPTRISHEVQTFAEYCSVIRYHSAFFKHLGGDDEPGERGERPSSSKAVSTISIAFSPDSQTMASTHGDHTVKITCCSSGMLLQTLDGHPRTPWTVKYHPIDPALLASGCLGHQVRLWHWPDKVCLQMIRLEFAIISLSFHPAGNLLAVANGTRLHFWGFNQNNTDTATGAADRPGAGTRNSRGILTEVDQRHMLRCVHFPPEGNTIIIGGVNPTTDDPRRRSRGGIGGGGMSFYLRLWDFDVGAALQTFDNTTTTGRRRAISNPRTFVPRALLYNDGGFDVSPDGKVLCACAEYWLPEGVNNAMELLQREEDADDCSGEGLENQSEDVNTKLKASEVDRETGTSTPTPTEGKEKSQSALKSTPPPRHQSADGTSFSTPVQQTPPPNNSSGNAGPDYAPQTPPRRSRPRLDLSPPSPPGRRFSGGVGHRGGNNGGGNNTNESSNGMQPLLSTPTQNQQGGHGQIPPPPPPPPPPGIVSRPPHPLSVISGASNYEDVMNKKGRYVPHVVTVSLDTTHLSDAGCLQRGMPRLTPVARGYRPRLGQLLEASPLDGAKASAVTCVKFSPSTDFCLIGYGVREPVVEGGSEYHPVTALYRVRGGMTHVSTMLSGDDDVNIARFHPDSGHGFVYGTKQGRVRVLSPRPWNFYNS